MPISSTSSYANTPFAVLAADVPNGGTLTVNYPAGTTQADFTGANAGATTDNMIVFRPSGDKYTGAAVGLTYGASNVTVTNNSGVTWSVSGTGGTSGVVQYIVGLPRIDPLQRYNGPKAILN